MCISIKLWGLYIYLEIQVKVLLYPLIAVHKGEKVSDIGLS